MPQALSDIGALARAREPDRFFCALFAPPERREALFALIAYHHELGRAREVASNPMIAAIRLQWWRDALEVGRRHEVATPLCAAMAEGLLLREDLLAMVDAREAELDEEGIPSEAAFAACLQPGPGSRGDDPVTQGHGRLDGAGGLQQGVRHIGFRQGGRGSRVCSGERPGCVALGLGPAARISAIGRDQGEEPFRRHLSHAPSAPGRISARVCLKARRPRDNRLSNASTLTDIRAAASILVSS
jgi:phytoene synthase